MILILLSLLCIPNPPLVQVLYADVQVVDQTSGEISKVTLLYVNSNHGTDGKSFGVRREFLTIMFGSKSEEFHFKPEPLQLGQYTANETLYQLRQVCIDKDVIDLFNNVVDQHGTKLPHEKEGVWLKVVGEK